MEKNLALERPATQSSVYSSSHPPGLAVDGNADTAWAGGSCVHTASSADPWWAVDLGFSRNVGTVTIYNRQDCCWDRINPLRVHVADSVSGLSDATRCGGDHRFREGQASLAVACSGRKGQMVVIQLPGSGRTLNMCEVKVYEATNIALGRPTQQSSHHRYSQPGGRVVDGSNNTNYRVAPFCVHTDGGTDGRDPWWYVNLGTTRTIGYVTIFTRQDCCPERISPFRIHIGDSADVSANARCGDSHTFPADRADMTVSCFGMTGQYVGILLPGSDRILQLCEVEVYPAPEGFSVLAQSSGWEDPGFGADSTYVIANGQQSRVESAPGTCGQSAFRHYPQTGCGGSAVDITGYSGVSLQFCAEACCAQQTCLSFQYSITADCYLKTKLCSASEKLSSANGNMYDRLILPVIRRGHQVFIVNEQTGAVVERAVFDTHHGGGGVTAAQQLTTFLQGIAEGRVIAVVVHDSGDTNADNEPDLAAYGSTTTRLGTRESWAMISQKGAIPSWFVEGTSARGAGPTTVQAYIPTDPSTPTPSPPPDPETPLRYCWSSEYGLSAVDGYLSGGERSSDPPNYWYLGDFSDSQGYAGCAKACDAEPLCVAFAFHYSAYGNTWGSQCYGRGSYPDTLVPSANIVSGQRLGLRCGDDSCVQELGGCDGWADCPGGRDESPAVCDGEQATAVQAVQGKSVLQEDTAVQGKSSLQEATAVHGKASLQEATAVQGKSLLQEATAVQGKSVLQEDTAVQGKSSLQEATAVQAVQGKSSLQEATAVQGKSLLQEATAVQGKSVLQEDTAVQGKSSLQEATAVHGKASLQEATAVQAVQGKSLLQEATAVQGKSVLQEDTAVQGKSSLQKATAVQGKSSLQKATTVQGKSSLQEATAVQAVQGKSVLQEATAVQGKSLLQEATAVQGKSVLQEETAVQGKSSLQEATAVQGESLLQEATAVQAVQGKSVLQEDTAVQGKSVLQEATAVQGKSLLQEATAVQGKSVLQEATAVQAAPTRQLVCEGQTMSIDCPAGTQIGVLWALFGRIKQDAPPCASSPNTDCRYGSRWLDLTTGNAACYCTGG
ncbi:uncharacterized protein [Branchiostoma lanceolatum]|uniref:uncharacterized protein n=1 Tax=Branchiostoma lanceolatum TaxID=7740 RepID=UPI00345308BB